MSGGILKLGCHSDKLKKLMKPKFSSGILSHVQLSSFVVNLTSINFPDRTFT
jgi:hypothetical protein